MSTCGIVMEWYERGDPKGSGYLVTAFRGLIIGANHRDQAA